MLDDVENLLDQAIAAHESSDFKTAFHLYREILTEDQTQPDANHNFGALLAQLGLIDNALVFIQNAVNSNPHVYEYWVSLIDLLNTYNAPKNIDYLSIDTEGSEFEIIKNLDFNKFRPCTITIEHNYEKIKRNKILNLLTKNNYLRVFKQVSRFDDWYIDKNIL